MFYPDGSYDESKCLMKLTDLYNYQDELKAFKEKMDGIRFLLDSRR